jgi:predicted mannosyl-3-phosphoglycerate phosphatase (HAD superfamily)
MGWSVKRARKYSDVVPTRNRKGLTATIRITVRDSGVTEVNGSPVWTEHPEIGATEAISALLVEFYKDVERRKKELSAASGATA